jgi:hypothetical protein
VATSNQENHDSEERTGYTGHHDIKGERRLQNEKEKPKSYQHPTNCSVHFAETHLLSSLSSIYREPIPGRELFAQEYRYLTNTQCLSIARPS